MTRSATLNKKRENESDTLKKYDTKFNIWMRSHVGLGVTRHYYNPNVIVTHASFLST